MKKEYPHYKHLLYFLLLAPALLQSCSYGSKPFYSREAANWSTHQPKDTSDLIYTVFLIGDAGAPERDRQEPTLKLLESQLNAANENSTAIFLGDNVYHHGLPKPGAYDRKIAEERLNSQLNVLRNFKGEKYIIPGNHDWENGGPDGLEAALRQERYVEEYLKDTAFVSGGNFFVPDDGCPGPYEVKIWDDIVLIVLNSQWWLHPYEKPYGDNNYCRVSNEVDFLVQLEDIIHKHSGSDILVVAHHPLFSNGIHGGYFNLTDHLFPLSIVRAWAYFPLPIIGSVYPLSRKWGGISQDIPHPDYQAFKKGLLGIFNKYDNIIYAAGHEHNLQYFKKGNLHHIVSGSGCKIQHVKGPGGDEAIYAQKVKGFAKVLYYNNGEVWAEYWAPVGDGSRGEVKFRTPLYSKATRPEEEELASSVSFADSSVVVAANKDFEAGKIRQWFLGKHYRKEWTTPIQVPLLDLGTEYGGLKPYKKGGGKQTASLKVRNEEAREYQLRAIDKDPTMALPESLRGTFARDILKDQISAQHPYGALVVPKLADAAGVYHTNPKLVYIPHDPRLRNYISEFSNTLAYLEEDPDENHEDVASLGYAENLVGTDKVLERLRDDNDNSVNEKAFARARLLDMWLGDWDRHEGQWRWAEEKSDTGRYYTPVPEDRDMVFFKADGIIPWLASRKWAVRNVKNFGYRIEDPVGLNLSGLMNDRTFTSSVTREDWLAIARDMKDNISDQEIEEAVRALPPQIYELSGPEIVAKLKSRRSDLPKAAETYYNLLAKAVDITGSDKHERFEVKRLNKDETLVTVYKITKEGVIRKKIYERTFYTRETDEIRLYGMAGQDQFEVTGNVSDGIKVRIIGGEDEDHIVDRSRVGGLSKKTIVYDTEEGNRFEFSSETKNDTRPFPEVNLYDRDNFKISYIGPRLSFAYNIDDGLFAGGGILVRTHGFRRKPFAAEHSLVANYAFATNSYNIRYNSDITQVIRDWDLNTRFNILGPQFLLNYFGLGNETEQNNDRIADYRVRFSSLFFSPTLSKNLTSFMRFGIGPQYERFEVEKARSGPFILQQAEQGLLEEGSLEPNDYVGVRTFIHMGSSTPPANPRIGIHLNNEFTWNKQIGGEGLQYSRVHSEAKFYASLNLPFQVTGAFRLGFAHNFGDFRFYQANTLGGTTNLRGYRRTRFAGRTVLYNNVEARVHLFKFNLYLFPGRFGVLGLLDHGRVWADGERRASFFDSLHRGYGGGVWVDVLKRFVVSGTYSVGEDENLYNVQFGFLF